jgi:predicted dehydrogenase
VALNLASLENVEFKVVCDLEGTRAASAAKALENTQGKLPQTTPDIRTVFDDKDVHGVLVATPEQWHALATIWACQAGKDVYVEKCFRKGLLLPRSRKGDRHHMRCPVRVVTGIGSFAVIR